MAITIEGKVYRNAAEQIDKNKKDIEALESGITAPTFATIQGNPSDNALLGAVLSSKVDKELGMGLSRNDFNNLYKAKLESINMSTKQDKLSQAQIDATNSGITATNYANLTNYVEDALPDKEWKLETDTPTKLQIIRDDDNHKTKINVTVTGGGGSEPASYIKQITKGGNTYTATRKDDTNIQWTIPDISDKQDKINDLATIREGASAGATALQPSALNPYRTANDQDTIDTALSNSVTAEQTRAREVEDTLSDGLSNEMSARLLKDTELTNAINTKEPIINDSHKILYRYIDGAPTVMIYKGTCLQADLPTSGQILGDYWKLSDAEPSVYSGQCAIWSGSKWEYSSSSIDLSGYYTKTAADAKFATITELDNKQDKLPEGEDGKYLKAELNPGSGAMELKWEEIPAGPDTYIKTVNLGTANRIVFTKKDDTTQQFDVDLSAYRTAANQNEIDATFVKLTGDQVITGVKKFVEVWAGETNEYGKLFKDCIQHEKNGTAYEYSYPNKNGTFAMTSDVPDLSTIKQAIYDGIYPVNNIQFGFQAPGVPEGVTATWTDVSSTYNGRYFKVSSTSAAGTSEAESLPLPSVSLDSQGAHKHSRGDMNITGLLRTCPSADSNVGDTMPIKHASGAFYNAGTAGSGYQRVYDINASYSRDTNSATIGFNAASNWTGETSQNGGHSHTATVGGTPYASGAAVKPLTTTIKVFKRTA